MFSDFFEYCTFDNPVFCSGVFWGIVFIFTFIRTVKYRIAEDKERAIEREIIKKYMEEQGLSKSTKLNKRTSDKAPIVLPEVKQSPLKPEQKTFKELPTITTKTETVKQQSPLKKAKKNKKKVVEPVVIPTGEVKTYLPVKQTKDNAEEDWSFVDR